MTVNTGPDHRSIRADEVRPVNVTLPMSSWQAVS